MSKVPFLFLLGVLVGMMGCGQSEISKKLTSSVSAAPDSNRSASTVSASVNLWVSPVRNSSKADIKASDNLEALVSKSSTALPGLKSETGGLQSNYLRVQNASDDSFSPSVADWKNKNISWTKEDFQNFMAFAHFGRGIDRSMELFKSNLITTRTNSAGQPIFPLKVYANECCNATSTGYDPSTREVLFYIHSGSTLPFFNMIDEADVAYHEYGHVLQHALNRVVLESNYGANPSVDALLEALSDFYGAAMVQNDNAFAYMSNNISALISAAGNRTGPIYNRTVANTLRFPNHYTADAHLDGRVIAAALNDIRKYFEGGVYPIGCASDTCYLSNSHFKLSKASAFEQTARLAYGAFSYFSTSSTLHRYSALLISEWNDRLYKDKAAGFCDASNVSCKQAVAQALSSILAGRGLYSRYSAVASDYVNSPALSAPSQISFMPYVGSGFANTNTLLEPCETVMVYPNIVNTSNNTSQPVDWVEGLAKINSYTGFVRKQTSGVYLEDVSTAADQTAKLIPWIEPGESSASLVGNTESRLYTQSPLGSTFLRPLSSSYKPSAAGWLLKAPASGSASISYEIEVRPYNATGNYWFKKTITQSISVSAGFANFCQ